jgi:hypothetical protein
VDQVDARRHGRARWQQQPPDLDRARQPPRDERQDRPQAKRLLHHRVGVGVVARSRLLAQAVELLRMPNETLDRPRERGGGRLVAGDQQRHELVAQFLVAHRPAILVAGLEEQREDVLALVQSGVVPAFRDLLIYESVDRATRSLEEREPFDASRAEDRKDQEPPAVDCPVEQVAQRGADAVEPGTLVDPEDGAHDDLERDVLHLRPDLKRAALGPALDLRAGDLGDHLPVALHALAVEGRQQELALRHVRRLVQEQDGVVTEQR